MGSYIRKGIGMRKILYMELHHPFLSIKEDILSGTDFDIRYRLVLIKGNSFDRLADEFKKELI